jgi:hypothetical protein
MILATKYLSFGTRIRKEFLAVFVVVTLIILYNYFAGKSEIGFSVIMILGFGIVYMAISAINAWTFVNEVKITEGKIIVGGAHINSHWKKEFDIANSEIKIKSKGRGRGNIGYYLRISSQYHSVDINRTFNWDYPSLLTIFYEFKRIKGEQIILDEKYFLDIIETKGLRS